MTTTLTTSAQHYARLRSSALAAHLNSRASAVRARAVDALLDDFGAITVSARLAVSPQKVYEISRGDRTDNFIDGTPRRQQ